MERGYKMSRYGMAILQSDQLFLNQYNQDNGNRFTQDQLELFHKMAAERGLQLDWECVDGEWLTVAQQIHAEIQP